MVLAHNLDGVVADNKFLFDEAHHIQMLTAAGKCLLTYGQGNTDPETILRQVAMGITGLCTDDLGLCHATLLAQRVLQGVASMPALSLLDDGRENQPMAFPASDFVPIMASSAPAVLPQMVSVSVS